MVLPDANCDVANELYVTAKSKIKGKKCGVFGNLIYKGGNRSDERSWDASGMVVTK